jgi:hypothetical protein
VNGKYQVLILSASNEWTAFTTDTPWPDLFSKYHIGDVAEMNGNFAPWTMRFIDSNGTIIIIDMPGGTLD